MAKVAKILSAFYFIVDVSLLIGAFLGVSSLLYRELHTSWSIWYLIGGLILIWVVASSSRRLYTTQLHNGVKHRIITYTEVHVVFILMSMGVVFLLPKFPFHDGELALLTGVVFVSVDFIVNLVLVSVISHLRRRDKKEILIAGAGELAARITHYIDFNPDFGYEIKGYFKPNKEVCHVAPEKILGHVREIGSYLKENSADEILVALPYKSSRKNIKHIIDTADFHGIRVDYVPDYNGLFGPTARPGTALDAIHVRQLPLDEFAAMLPKQLFDVVFAAFVLAFLSPVLMLIAIAIKLESPGSAFYCPIRVGRGGKTFRLYKFRTMYVNDSAENGTLSTRKDDERITRVGRILRKTNLDELPQFLNVLLGDMSVVGPRPHRVFLNKQMQEHVNGYMIRYYFKPGITGWAQVNGWRGPTENEEQISQRTAYDLWYFEHWSFILDIKIIWLTIFGRKTYQNAY